jgi:hypothetical protein
MKMKHAGRDLPEAQHPAIQKVGRSALPCVSSPIKHKTTQVADQRSSGEPRKRSSHLKFVPLALCLAGLHPPTAIHSHPLGRIGSTYVSWLRRLHIPTHDATKSASFTSLMVMVNPHSPNLALPSPRLVSYDRNHCAAGVAILTFGSYITMKHSIKLKSSVLCFPHPRRPSAPRRWNYSTSSVLRV